jgi:hypothetical protein
MNTTLIGRPIVSLSCCLILGVGFSLTATAGPADKIYSAAVLRELTDISIAGINKRLGPDYAHYHPGGVTEQFPEIYLAPSKKMPPEAGAESMREWQLGGPYRQEAGDYSSTQGQVIYMADRPLAMEGQPLMPNDGIGVDRVTIIEMSHHCFSEKPQQPWWGDGFRPDPTTKRWIDVAGWDKIGRPIATARGMGNWANCGMVVFSSGFIGVAGTVTAHHTNPTFQFPKNKIPTAVSITSKNEMALVTVIDSQTMKGQVAVFALSVNGKVTAMPHEWGEEVSLLSNVAAFTGIKLLGYVDLPGMDLPTGIYSVGDRTGGRVSGRDGHAGMLSEYNLSVQADRDQFNTGHNKDYATKAGFAIVISKHEAKVAFIDLQPLFMEARNAYFTTEENFQKTRKYGPAPDQWPYTFDVFPAWKPTVVKMLDVPHPTAAFATPWGGPGAWAAVASVDGTITIFNVGGLANESPAAATEIVATVTGKIGRNPTHLAFDKYGTANFIAVCRGDREIDWVSLAGGKVTVTRRLRDARLIDPVYAEVADTHGIETPMLTVADYNGRKILNYRYGTLIFATQGGEKFGMGPTGTDEFECGGILEFPGHPFSISATNVN